MGITVALAWELPSKPPSEIIEELQDKLNDGTLGLHRNDTFNKIKYINTPTSKQKINIPSFYQPSPTNSHYKRPPHNYGNWNEYSASNWKIRPEMNYSSYLQNKNDNYYNQFNYTNFNRKQGNIFSKYSTDNWNLNRKSQ